MLALSLAYNVKIIKALKFYLAINIFFFVSPRFLCLSTQCSLNAPLSFIFFSKKKIVFISLIARLSRKFFFSRDGDVT